MPRIPSKSAPANPGCREEMIVKKIDVSSRQPLNFRQSRIHGLCVKGTAPLKERVLIAEIAGVRAAARDHERVGYQI